MSLILRNRLIIGAAALAAVWISFQIADTSYAVAVLVGVIALATAMVTITGASLEAITIAGVLFGYIVGNRGFAQFMPIPNVPLLPAEFALLVAGTAIFIRSAMSRTVPCRSDALNWTIAAWLIAGTIRVAFDVKPYGFLAIRDYAMVYYAVFFYVGQSIASEARSRRFVLLVMIIAAIVQPIAGIGSEMFPELMWQDLSVRGVPLILFKGDLLYTFVGVSAFFVALALPQRFRPWTWAFATLELLFVITGANRASMVGAIAALGWLGISRLRRFAFIQAAVMSGGILVAAALISIFHNEAVGKKFAVATDRVRSIADVFGTSTYRSSEAAMKGDDNRFRTLWWGTVYDELMAENPTFGLGFGYDLARGFLEKYNPDIEDFTARSPHSIVMTVLGRMGFVGLAAFLLVIAAFAHATWRAMRHPGAAPSIIAVWCSGWVIFVSACFGVVLEGPMGAVVFWALLGIGNAMLHDEPIPAEPVVGDMAPAALPNVAAREPIRLIIGGS